MTKTGRNYKRYELTTYKLTTVRVDRLPLFDGIGISCLVCSYSLALLRSHDMMFTYINVNVTHKHQQNKVRTSIQKKIQHHKHTDCCIIYLLLKCHLEYSIILYKSTMHIFYISGSATIWWKWWRRREER